MKQIFTFLKSFTLGFPEANAPQPSRRKFFGALSGGALGLASLSFFKPAVAEASTAEVGPLARAERRARKIDKLRYRRALKVRFRAFRRFRKKRLPRQRSNRDIQQFGSSFSYTKVLRKNSVGEPIGNDFEIYQREINRGKFQRFEDNVVTGAKGFKNPLGAHAVGLDGFDASQFTIPVAPSVDSPQVAAEMSELYWMAMARDVSFDNYWTSSITSDAILDLSQNYSDFRGPTTGGELTPDTLFRVNLSGRQTGPAISQFLLQDVTTGRLSFPQRLQTSIPASDWMTRPDFFLFRQGGNRDGNDHVFDPVKRYIRNGRDLSMYVWDDRTFAPYLHAFYILYAKEAERDSGNPYTIARASTGFLTGDYPQPMSQLAAVAMAALRAAWWQKWVVHQRLRPEELAGRLHFHSTGEQLYPFLSSEILNSVVLDRIFDFNSNIESGVFGGNGASYLLPQSYPEGSPNHPAYPSGHATMAGACVTLLKAWFSEAALVEDTVVANGDGTGLVSYEDESLTIGGELNKLASNICEGRLFAGIHYRSDVEAGLRLGEQVATELLRQWNKTYAEPFRLSYTSFDGEVVRIR